MDRHCLSTRGRTRAERYWPSTDPDRRNCKRASLVSRVTPPVGRMPGAVGPGSWTACSRRLPRF
jgi:hypothetical protein